MGTGVAAPARPSLVRVAPLIVLVALCAGFLSGSCAACAVEVENSNAAAVLPAALAAGVALAIGLLFLVVTRDRREVRFFAVIGVAAYIAAEFGAWWPFLWPLIALLLTAIVGGVNAGSVAGKAFGVSRGKRRGVAVVVSAAILIAAIAVVAGFWSNYDMGLNFLGGGSSPSSLNTSRFALIAGVVPPVVAAVGAWLAGFICRRAGNRL